MVRDENSVFRELINIFVSNGDIEKVVIRGVLMLVLMSIGREYERSVKTEGL